MAATPSDESAAGVPSPLRGEGGAQRRVRGSKVTEIGVAKARRLRREQTDAERRLWNLLRNRSVHRLKFVRQHPIGPFVADFVCRERMLVVELDGSQHVEEAEYDARRTAYLNRRGYSVLRFWNTDALQHLGAVEEMLAALASGIEIGPSPGWRYSPATLSPEGRGDAAEGIE